MNEISTFPLLGLSNFLHFCLFDFSVLRFFYHVSPLSILRFFDIFSKMMKINRFYKLFCVSGDFVSQNGP